MLAWAAAMPLSGAALVPVPAPKFSLQAGGLEVNRGQAKPEVLFVARGSSPAAVLAQSVVFSPSGVAQNLVASNPNPRVSFSDPLPGTVNSFTGADRGKWLSQIPRYATARLAGVYPGIDAEYSSRSDGHLILRFLLQAGVDPAIIGLDVPMSFGLTTGADGSLRIALGQAKFGLALFYNAPVAFQDTSTGRVSRKATFATRSSTLFGFQVDQLSNATPLEIEMTLAATGFAVSPSVAPVADLDGNWFVASTVVDGAGKDPPFPGDKWAGCGDGIGFPIACTDVALLKFSKNGDLIFASYLAGRTREEPTFLQLSPDGAVVITGSTDSSDFPVTQGAVQAAYGGPAASLGTGSSSPVSGDFFAARLDPSTGALLASTYLGGPNPEQMGDTALGADGSVYFLHKWLVASRPGMRTTPGALQATCDQDPCVNGYAAHLSAGLDKLLYGTYLPGNVDASAHLLGDGSVYYAGSAGAGFPTTPGAYQSQAAGGYDGIVARLDASGTRLLFATYIGGPLTDWILRMAVAPDGSVWVSVSSFTQCCVDIQYRLVHLDASGQRILADVPVDIGDIAVDRQGNLIATSGGKFHVRQDAFLANACPSWYIAYVRLSPSGEQLFATYLPYSTGYDFAGAGDRGTPLLQIGADRFDVVEGQELGPYLGCTVDAASFGNGDVISPGGIVTLFGSKLGPQAGVSFSLQNGRVPTTLSGTRVLVNGEAVPVLYASYWQVNAILPFSLAEGTGPTIQVESNGVVTNLRLDARVQNAGIAIFRADSTPNGQAAALNQDGTVNSMKNPAKAGSVIALFGTGGGPTIPASVAGEVTPLELRRLATSIVVSAGTQPLQVLYAGAAPGLVAGVMQINAKLPDVIPQIQGAGTLPINVVAQGTYYPGYVTVAVSP
jgi:uncharacterized protein (TIGR03437 family)